MLESYDSTIALRSNGNQALTIPVTVWKSILSDRVFSVIATVVNDQALLGVIERALFF